MAPHPVAGLIKCGKNNEPFPQIGRREILIRARVCVCVFAKISSPSRLKGSAANQEDP